MTGEYDDDLATIRAAQEAARPPEPTGPITKQFGDYRDAVTQYAAIASDNGNSRPVRLPIGLNVYRPGDLGGHISPPSSQVLIGPIGEWLTLIEPETETSLAALGVGALTALGAWLGNQVVLTVGRIEHRTNLLGVIVGPSAYSRKGTAASETRRFVKAISPDFAADNYAAGFGSGESIIDRLRDEETDQDGNVLRGTNDQRILVDEGEYARVLRSSSRQGSILSDIFRLAYDGSGKLEHRTIRGGTVISTNHHVSMFAAITPEELVETFTTLAAVNGAGNRNLWAWSDERKVLPDGGADVDMRPIARSIARSRSHTPYLRYTRTKAAADWWRDRYPTLRLLEHVSDRVRPIVSRTTDHVQRIALIYAAVEGAERIDVQHLEAGEAWANHSIETVTATMGNLVGSEVAGKVLTSLRSHPDKASTRTELHHVLSRNYTATQLDSALYELAANGLVHRWVGQASNGGGPKPEMVIATTPEQKL